MKTCFIYQPSGVGDILFCQKIAKHYRDMGYKVVWPLYQWFEWMKPYIEDEYISHPILSNERKILEPFEHSEQFFYLMCSTNALFRAPVVAADFIYLSLGPATLSASELMTAKYSVADVQYEHWQRYVKINRDYQKENDLFYNVLGLNDDSQYTFINEHCSTHKIDIQNLDNSVRMQVIPGFTGLDWIKVIEKASRLITIDTSVAHLAEIFLPYHVPCYLINRYNPPSFVDLHKIFKLNWNFCVSPDDIII